MTTAPTTRAHARRHTRALLACVSRLKHAGHVSWSWAAAAVVEASDVKDEHQQPKDTFSTSHNARSHAHSGWSLHTAAILRQYLQNPCLCREKKGANEQRKTGEWEQSRGRASRPALLPRRRLSACSSALRVASYRCCDQRLRIIPISRRWLQIDRPRLRSPLRCCVKLEALRRRAGGSEARRSSK